MFDDVRARRKEEVTEGMMSKQVSGLEENLYTDMDGEERNRGVQGAHLYRSVMKSWVGVEQYGHGCLSMIL